jgi:hypothetical protein
MTAVRRLLKLKLLFPMESLLPVESTDAILALLVGHWQTSFGKVSDF